VISSAILGAWLAYQLGPGNRDTSESADKHDVRFVLNWCQLGDERIEEVAEPSVPGDA
jgi:hypothetical protein